MKQIVIKDGRGQAVAVVGSQAEFESLPDTARVMGIAAHEKMAWLDWIESSAPGNGSSLMRELLVALEAEGVALIGLEACATSQHHRDRLGKFYEKFGFVDVSILAPWSEHQLYLRDSGWNGME